MEKLHSVCVKCGTALAERTGSGRPATYCTSACRRSAEYELRRVQAAIESVEKRAREHGEYVALPSGWPPNCCGRGDRAVQHLEWIESERVRLEAGCGNCSTTAGPRRDLFGRGCRA